jgi:hypothetical protein
MVVRLYPNLSSISMKNRKCRAFEMREARGLNISFCGKIEG